MLIKILAFLFILVGVILIYDARILVDNWFGFGDQNEATSRAKNSWLYHSNYRSNHDLCDLDKK